MEKNVSSTSGLCLEGVCEGSTGKSQSGCNADFKVRGWVALRTAPCSDKPRGKNRDKQSMVSLSSALGRLSWLDLFSMSNCVMYLWGPNGNINCLKS